MSVGQTLYVAEEGEADIGDIAEVAITEVTDKLAAMPKQYIPTATRRSRLRTIYYSLIWTQSRDWWFAAKCTRKSAQTRPFRSTKARK